MKRNWFVSVLALLSIVLSAQDYQIAFAISGDSETILDSVLVHNIDQDRMVTLRGDDVLHLQASLTGIQDISSPNEHIKIYPNPFSDKTTIVFKNHNQGQVKLSLLDMGGKIATQKSQFLSEGKTFVELRGVPMGAYVIQIVTEASVFSEVILSDGASRSFPEFTFKGSGENVLAPVYSLKSSSESNDTVNMQYNEGDTLSLTAYLNSFSLEKRIVPVDNTTVSFGFFTNMEDISTKAEISIEGGVLQVIDESGNTIKLSFPPGAVMDSTTVSLTLLGEQKNLPIHERKLRPFEIRPADLSLYRPVEISIEYSTAIHEIEHVALFRMPSDSFLIPLGEHMYAEDNKILTASTLILGDFAEGNLSFEQVNTQFNLLLSLLGISWETILKSSEQENQPVSNGDLQKYIWDETWGNAMGILKLRELGPLKKPEGEPSGEEPAFEEEIEKICKTVMHDGVLEILDLGLPDDPCDRNYTHTLTKMMRDMNVLGCVKGDDFKQLKAKFEEMLLNCHSFLSINSDLDIEAGGLTVNTNGVVPVFTTASDNYTGTVAGMNTLPVTGGSNIQGSCTSTVTGATLVEVSGTRDATYTYVLTLKTHQDALLTTVCPDITKETPLTGTGTRVVTLTKANGFQVSTIEEVDQGTFKMDIMLNNPYTTMPAEE